MTVSAPSADAVSMQMAAVQNGLAGPSMMSPAMMPQGVASPQAARDMASGVDIGSDKVITSPVSGNLLQCLITGCSPHLYRREIP